MPVGGRQVGGVVADLVAGWTRWRPGQFATPPMSPLGGETPGTRKVELYISEAWVDITRLDRDTPGVYYRDNITITRGLSGEGATLERSTCRFTLNNRDGRFSPRNPNSLYYGKIGRNTPVRVSVVQANGVRRYRFYGEISAWPQKWDQSGTDVYVQIEASGILRRLGQGTSPLNSPMYRGSVRDTSYLVAYWPCEDASSATTIASAVSGVSPMTIAGKPTLFSDTTSFVASEALPVMANGSFTGYVPTYNTALSQHQVRFCMAVPNAGATDGQIICSVYMSGSIVRWELVYASGGAMKLHGYDSADVLVADSGAVAFGVNGSPVRVSIELTRSGSTVTYLMSTVAPGASSGTFSSNTVAAGSLGRITRVVLATNKGLTTTTLGHLTVQAKQTSLFDLGAQLNAYASEHAGVRIGRLCTEEGISFTRWQPQGNTMAMGYQGTQTLLALISAATDADMGRLWEPRDQMGFSYRDRESLYDQSAILALDYSLAQLSESLDPVDDDTYTRNDITVTRDNSGGSTRTTKDTGTNSIAAVGRYDTSVTLNVQTDTLLPDVAGWKLHLGTIDEARYPTIQIELSHPTFATSDAMTSAALVLDIGDRITISNLPSWLPPDQISLIVEGYTEKIAGNGMHTITFNCSPASPHTVPIYNSATYRYSSDGSTLTSDLDATNGILRVTTPSGPVWSVTDGSFDITIGGERMTVTNIALGGTSPQTFTVTRSVNGIVKTHSAGDTVSLFTPAYYGI